MGTQPEGGGHRAEVGKGVSVAEGEGVGEAIAVGSEAAMGVRVNTAGDTPGVGTAVVGGTVGEAEGGWLLVGVGVARWATLIPASLNPTKEIPPSRASESKAVSTPPKS